MSGLPASPSFDHSGKVSLESQARPYYSKIRSFDSFLSAWPRDTAKRSSKGYGFFFIIEEKSEAARKLPSLQAPANFDL